MTLPSTDVDHSQANHVSLCAGYGGIDIGLRRAVPRLRTIAYSEIEGYACANLVAKIEAGLLDPAPIWTDVKSFPYGQFHGCVHILSGGYPCQPFSAAGKRLGRDDPRHLWPWIADGIALMRPSLCFFENVEGHITLGLRDVINDLGELGYRTTWGIFSAAEVGAPHQRKRVFILAHKLSAGLEGLLHDITAQGREDERGPATRCSQPVSELADSDANGLQYVQQSSDGRKTATATQCGGPAWPSRPGEQQYGWEPPRVVANTKLAVDRSEAGRDQVDQSNAQRPTGWIGGSSQGMGNANRGRDTQSEYQFTNLSTESSGGNEEALGDSQSGNGKGQQLHIRQGQREHRGTSGSECEWRRKAEPPLGGNSDGSSRRLDNGYLFRSTCNRTDELRLLGNGVVPATAALAFTTLLKELS